MILDYSEYVTERGSSGIVNFVRADNGTDLFMHNSVCPFCQKRITSKVYNKSSRDYPEWLFGSGTAFQHTQLLNCFISGGISLILNPNFSRLLSCGVILHCIPCSKAKPPF